MTKNEKLFSGLGKKAWVSTSALPRSDLATLPERPRLGARIESPSGFCFSGCASETRRPLPRGSVAVNLQTWIGKQRLFPWLEHGAPGVFWAPVSAVARGKSAGGGGGGGRRCSE